MSSGQVLEHLEVLYQWVAEAKAFDLISEGISAMALLNTIYHHLAIDAMCRSGDYARAMPRFSPKHL